MRNVVLLSAQDPGSLEPLVRALLVAPGLDVWVAAADATKSVAERLARESPRVAVQVRGSLGANASAVREGFAWALAQGYDQIITMESDFSHPPEAVPELLLALRTADGAIGSRQVEGGRLELANQGRRLLSRAANGYARQVLRLPYQDPTSGFVALKRHVVEACALVSAPGEGPEFHLEIKHRAYWAGFILVEVPVAARPQALPPPGQVLATAAGVVRRWWSR